LVNAWMRSSGRRFGSVHGAKSRFEPAICVHSDGNVGMLAGSLTQIMPTDKYDRRVARRWR